MLESVRSYLSLFGNSSEKILKAMEKIDRRDFVSRNLVEFAYVDNALPTEKNQTISQPSTVARMLQLLRLKSGDRVLEVGAGSGWNACLIGFLVRERGSVLSLEVVDELVEKARGRVEKFGIENVEILKKDFRELDEKFDKIIFTAGVLQGQENIIRDYADRYLREGGVLVCPYRSGKMMSFEKVDGEIKESQTDEEYVFVELVL